MTATALTFEFPPHPGGPAEEARDRKLMGQALVALHRINSGRFIRERAYFIWEDEGCPDGRALDHWLQAEREHKEWTSA